MLKNLGLAFGLFVVMVNASVAQTIDDVATSMPILVINSDRLYAESQLGKDYRTNIEEQVIAFQEENERIVADLIAEEQDLADRRSGMADEEFRLAAEAFDQKAQEIRAARDAKTREITQLDTTGRSQFNDQVREIVGQIMLEREGVLVLDSRSVYLALRTIDITDDVIERLDALTAAAQTED